MPEGLAFSCEPWHVLGKYAFYKYKETPLLALLFQRIIFEEQSFNCTIFHFHFIKNESYFPKSMKRIYLIIESVFETFQRKLTSFKNGCWTERNAESKFGWLSKKARLDFFKTFFQQNFLKKLCWFDQKNFLLNFIEIFETFSEKLKNLWETFSFCQAQYFEDKYFFFKNGQSRPFERVQILWSISYSKKFRELEVYKRKNFYPWIFFSSLRKFELWTSKGYCLHVKCMKKKSFVSKLLIKQKFSIQCVFCKENYRSCFSKICHKPSIFSKRL